MVVADWIIGIWTCAASLMIVVGCIMQLAVWFDSRPNSKAIKILLFGLFLGIFSAMHYSGM